jgi:diacylglycerol kinase family enzyme
MGTANLVGQYLGLERGFLAMGLEGIQALAHQVSPQKLLRRLPGLRLGPMTLHPRRTARRVLQRLLPPAAQVARESADRALRALDRAEIHRLDLGMANGRLFLLMAGVGFDAHVVHVLDERRSGPIGLLSYVLPAASAVARYGFPPIRVEVDGKRVFGPKPAVVMVANLPQYGTGFPIVPGARGDDRSLDVLCLPCNSRVRLGELFALAADQRHLTVTGAVTATGARVDIVADSPVPVQIDGDPGGTLPLNVTLHEAQLPLIRPVS